MFTCGQKVRFAGNPISLHRRRAAVIGQQGTVLAIHAARLHDGFFAIEVAWQNGITLNMHVHELVHATPET